MRYVDLLNETAADLSPGIRVRLIPELRLAVQVGGGRLLLWRGVSVQPEILLESGDDIIISQFFYSRRDETVYLKALVEGDNETPRLWVIPARGVEPIKSFNGGWGSVFIEALIGNSKYPEIPVNEDLRVTQVGEFLTVQDLARSRIEAFFSFECEMRGEEISRLEGERGELLREICRTQSFELIEEFIRGQAFSSFALPDFFSRL